MTSTSRSVLEGNISCPSPESAHKISSDGWQDSVSDVSCRIIKSHFDYLVKIGSDPHEFLGRINTKYPGDFPFTYEFLATTRNRVSWETFVRISDELELMHHGRQDWEENYISHSLNKERSWVPYMTAVARLVSSPHQLYWINNKLWGPSLFSNIIGATFEVLEDGRFLVELAIRPEVRDNPQFFRISKVALERLPTLIGLGPSVVEFELSARKGRYWITPPPSRTLLARCLRWFNVFFNSASTFSEFRRQDRQLREHYLKLVRRENELKEVRAELERRVEQRTREIQTANERLKRQYEESVRREEENRQLQDRLMHLQKMEAVGALAGGISHEINNVLHGIFLSLELADMKLADDHPAKDRVQSGLKFASRGQGVMKQILSFSRKIHFEGKPTPILGAVREAVHLMRSTLPRNISITEHYQGIDEQISVLGDFTQLQQLLINMCSNAADAIGGREGQITVAAKLIETPSGEQIELSIEDTGEGISAEILPRIFDPFFTTKPIGRGTGMGLAIVHGIIRALDGQIKVDSKVGVGTCFRMTFPQTESVLEPIVPDAVHEEPRRGHESLLVIDDETDLLEVICETLQAYGYRVIASTSGESALSILKADVSKVDLVITDFSMPQINGIDLAKRIHSMRTDLPILLCTGFSDELIPELAGSGIVGRIKKPLDGGSMNKAVRAALSLN